MWQERCRPFAIVAGLAMCIFALVDNALAQSAEQWNDVLRKANAEGRVNFYTITPPDQVERVVEAFRKKNPNIKVSIVRGAADLIAKVETERSTGQDGADVFLFGDALWFKQNAENLLPLDSPGVKGIKGEFWAVPNKASIVSLPPLGVLVWNTKLVSKPPTGFQDVIDPIYKGQLGTREDMTPAYIGYLDFLEKNFGVEYMRRLGAQKPKFYASVVPLAQAVASGEVRLANISVPSIARDLMKQGAPINYLVPSPAFITPHVIGVLSASKRPNAARVFLDFLLSEDGQIALNGNGEAGSPLNVKGSIDLSNITLFDADKFTAPVREEWRKKFQEYFR